MEPYQKSQFQRATTNSYDLKKQLVVSKGNQDF